MMAKLTAADAPPDAVPRLGQDAEQTVENLGPLAGLVGTWIGAKGWELIAVPAKDDEGLTFRLIVRPYVEIITFEALGALVPNRGGPNGDLCISGLMYETRITDLETHEPLHLENGMWLNLGATDHPIVRQASIPHGDVILALGTGVPTRAGPKIPTIDGQPDGIPPHAFGYKEQWRTPRNGFVPASPNDVLQSAIAGQHIVQTVTLDLSTANGGGVLNIPFVEQNADAPKFVCTYWIETVQDDATGRTFLQLQYSQQTDMLFLMSGGDTPHLINWPHVNVNTLLKQ